MKASASICPDLLALETKSRSHGTDDQSIPWARSFIWSELLYRCAAMYPIRTGLICQKNIDCITHYQSRVSSLVNTRQMKAAIKSNTLEDVWPQADDPSVIIHLSLCLFFVLKNLSLSVSLSLKLYSFLINSSPCCSVHFLRPQAKRKQ